MRVYEFSAAGQPELSLCLSSDSNVNMNWLLTMTCPSAMLENKTQKSSEAAIMGQSSDGYALALLPSPFCRHDSPETPALPLSSPTAVLISFALRPESCWTLGPNQ